MFLHPGLLRTAEGESLTSIRRVPRRFSVFTVKGDVAEKKMSGRVQSCTSSHPQKLSFTELYQIRRSHSLSSQSSPSSPSSLSWPISSHSSLRYEHNAPRDRPVLRTSRTPASKLSTHSFASWSPSSTAPSTIHSPLTSWSISLEHRRYTSFFLASKA